MAAPILPASDNGLDAAEIHLKIGQLTRQLHNALHELGYAHGLHHSMHEAPDTQTRLSYIARLTGEAAEKVIARVESAKTEQHTISDARQQATRLLTQLQAGSAAVTQMQQLQQVQQLLGQIGQAAHSADEHLTDIMIAQEFHDLTTQVIRRVVDWATSIEKQLVELLIQTAPAVNTSNTSAENVALAGLAGAGAAAVVLDGPTVGAELASEVMTDQAQVDDLLASLGF